MKLKHLMKRLEEIMKRNAAYIIFSAIASFFLCLFVSDFVTDMAERHERYAAITVNCYSNDEAPKQFELELFGNHELIRSENFNEEFDGEKDAAVYSCTSLNAALIVNVPISFNTCLRIIDADNKSTYCILDNDGNVLRVINREDYIYRDVTEINYYLFDNAQSNYLFVWYALYYLLIWILGAAFILTLIYGGPFIYRWLLKRKITGKTMFYLIFIVQFFYTGIVYYFNQGVFVVSEMADAYYYLNPPFFDESGVFSLQYYANHTFTFRGYFPHLVSFLCSELGKLIQIDAFYFYTVLLSLLTAYTFAIAIPRLISVFKKPSGTMFLEIAISYVLFFIFWHPQLFYQMTDIPSALLCVCGISLLISSAVAEDKSKKEYGKMFCAGLFLGAAVSFRVSYSVVIALMTIVSLAILVIHGMKCSSFQNVCKECLTTVVSLLIGILIVSIPQYQINAERDKHSFFPYSYEWLYDADSGTGTTDTWYDFTYGLHRYQFSGSAYLDKQLFEIDEQYPTEKYYDMNDFLYIFFSDPISFLAEYMKKTFWAMSAALEAIYTWLPYNYEYYNVFAALLNYWLISNICYALLNPEKRSSFLPKAYGLFLLAIGLATAGIQGMAHMERRYYIFAYLLLYITNAYFILNRWKEMVQITDNSNRCRPSAKYWIFTCVFVVTAYVMRITFQANFI